MTINIVDICRYKYPGEIEKRNILFREVDNIISIYEWKVLGELKPTEEELIIYAQENKRAIEINKISIDISIGIQNIIDNTAKSKKYENSVSCVSYSLSTNNLWKLEAETFILWRDSIWSCAYNQLEIYLGNNDSLPTVDEFIKQLPTIVWP